MADYKTPQWLLPNEKNLAYPAAGDGITGSGLSEDRHSLYSMDFNGTDYISAPNTFLNSASVCTLSFWMKGTGEVGGGAPWNGIQIQAGATTTSFRTMNGSNVNNYVSFSPGTDWHHYLGVYVGGSYSKLYIDGVLKSTLSTGIPATLASTSGDIFKIGYGQSYSVAKIDEVAVWNRQLTDGGVADGVTAGGEIATIYNSGAPGSLMGLSFKPIAYYPLGEQAQMGSANWSFPNGSLQSHVVDFSTQDYIQYPHININGAFTVSTWVKTTDTNTYGNLFSSSNQFGGDPSGGSSIANNWKLIRWNRSARFNASNSSNSIIFDVNTGTSGTRPNLYDGNWHHVLAIWDGTTNSNGVKIFFDGVLRGLGTASSTAINNDNSIPIRAGSSNATFDFIGEQSNQQIWNTALTYGSASADGDIAGGDVANIYNNGSPQSTYTATPTAWWKLNAANSSYVYPWSLELNGDPDVSGGGDHAKVVSNALEIRDIDSSGASTGTGGKVDFLTKEITGAYSGIDVTGEFVINTASSYTNGATLYYKIDGGSWVQFQQQLDTSGSATYAISGASGLTSTTSFQVKIEFETGNSGSSTVTLNNISIGGLYTEDFTNQDGAGWDNDTYTPPPVDWTFIDTETPAPNYTSALSFDGGINNGININNDSSLEPLTSFTLSCWIKSETSQNSYAYPVYKQSSNGAHVAYGFYLQGTQTIATTVTTSGVVTSDNIGDLRDDKWHHIVQTYDGSGMKVYLDGVQSGSTKSITGNVDYSTTQPKLYIGETRHTSPSGYYSFKGEISNVALFNSAIDAAGVSTLFNSGTPQTSVSYSPTSWWKLDNITTGIQDSGSASNNGTITGSVTQIATNVLISNNGESDTLPTSALTPSDLQFESPYSNYSLSFDGIGNYIDCGTELGDSLGTYTGDLSLSYWFNTDSLTDNNGLFYIGSFSNTQGEFQVNIYSNSMRFRVEGGTQTKLLDIASLSTGTWYHIAFVYKAGNISGSKVYLNGVEQSTTDTGTFPSSLSFTGLKTIIGGYYGTANTFDGKMDEVAIWSSALTQAQITQVYNNGYPNDLTSLSPTSWWRLGEDAYFVGNDITIPNKITGGPTGTGSGTQTAILVGDAPGSYANGSGTNLVVGDRIGDAPESTANSVSINMIPSNRHTYPAGYVPTQVDNAFSMAFDGVSNSKFNVNPPTIGSDNTISAWAKRVGTGNMFLLGNTSSGGYGCYFVGTSGVYVQGSGGYFAFTNSAVTTAMVRTDWVNWVFIKNSSAGTVSVYVDGELAQSASSTGGMDSLTSIGGSGLPTGSQFPWNGNIDEVAVFNYILSERQIKQDIYEGTTAGKTADLNNISNLTAPVAWYRMGD